MLKEVPGHEHLVHICRQGTGNPEVNMHDVMPYMVIDGRLVPIKYCPYCGVKIEEDERK